MKLRRTSFRIERELHSKVASGNRLRAVLPCMTATSSCNLLSLPFEFTKMLEPVEDLFRMREMLKIRPARNLGDFVAQIERQCGLTCTSPHDMRRQKEDADPPHKLPAPHKTAQHSRDAAQMQHRAAAIRSARRRDTHAL